MLQANPPNLKAVLLEVVIYFSEVYVTYSILVQELKNRMLIFVSLISSELFLANEISSLAFGANFNGTRYDTLWILLFFFIEIDEIYRISYSENME